MSRFTLIGVAIVSLAIGVFIGSIGFLYITKGKGGVSTSQRTEMEEFKIDTLKVIGDVVIAREDVRAATDVPGINPNSKPSDQDVEKTLERLALFYNAAKDKGLTSDPQARRIAYWADKSAYADLYYRKYIMPLIKVDTSEVSDFIEAHKDEFSKELAMLVVVYQDPKLTDTLRKLLKDGSYAANLMLEEFAKKGKIAVQPSPYQNLGLGRFAMTPKEFESLKKAKVGDVVGPFQVAPGTYTLGKVVDIKRINIKDLDQNVKGVVYQYLLDQRRKQVEDSVTKELERKYAGGE